ncbi:riboflavin kinase [Cnuibacter physcomitrellae]|uniref:riboflavin kinase n=1 Tax=Cnuibacter physcomitrellae TaxID=1619308 RepID=UPI002175FFC4|nr:riboflavin kinase [Cnuibacter physcomitrellae]MCS5498271.1 riboflavin kinase [Cnuibacter physcomitrellae]
MKALRIDASDAHGRAPVMSVTGLVEHGDERGRLLGFPTINVPVGASIEEGVYGGLIRIGFPEGAQTFVAAVSVGRRETYYKEAGELLLEAFVLDFSREVYGLEVTVQLHRFIRGQRQFAGTDALVRHLRRDVEAVRRWAVAEGYRKLLADAGGAESRSGRWGPVQRRQPRDHEELSRARDERRLALIRRAVQAAPSPESVDHGYVAEWTGLPLPFVQHLFPTAEELLALAADGDSDGRPA